jgi:hypothetical protein
MNNTGNIVAYITKKYNIEQDAHNTAKRALEKIVQTKWGVDPSLLPDTPELYDTTDEAAQLIENKRFTDASELLLGFADCYQFLG